jgi:hypothetical protein
LKEGSYIGFIFLNGDCQGGFAKLKSFKIEVEKNNETRKDACK